jgi:hypothetical protein
LLEKTLAHRLSDGHQADKRWSMAQAAVNRAREAALRLARILDTNRPVAARISKPALAMVGVFSVICLAVLPYAPQFVAFDRGLRADSDPAYTAAVRQPASQSLPFASGEPRVVPRRSTTRPHAVAARQFAPVPAIAVRWNAEPPPTQMVRAGASADHELVPQFQTLVFIQATEYVTVDVPVWSVQVWRVTFVAAVPERLMKVPVASSI